MEFVPHAELDIKQYTTDSKISLIQSARHAVRVLQHADVSQADWCTDQLVVTPLDDMRESTGSPRLACVLIDFAMTTQGTVHCDAVKQDDYAGMADAIAVTKYDNGGCEEELVRKYFGPREVWDYCRTSFLDR